MIDEGILIFLITFITQAYIVYFRPIRADVYITVLIIITYFVELIPVVRAHQWHQRFNQAQTKLKIITLELEESRRKDAIDAEKENNEKKQASVSLNTETPEGKTFPSDPLDKCPKEIWVRILNSLEDCKDAIHCYHTCRLFRSLLETQMRAQAFLVLDNYLCKHSPSYMLYPNDILNCRLISPSWKLSVDHFLQHRPTQMNMLTYDYPRTVIDSYDTCYLKGLIQYWICNYHQGNSNPFVSRHLHLRIRGNMNPNDKPVFPEMIAILLKCFGRHIIYFTIYADVDGDEIETYQMVYNFLGQAANVKMVDLWFTETKKEKFTTDKLRRLEIFLLQHDFPMLKKLKEIKLFGCPDEMINAALQKNKHIEKLEVNAAWPSHAWIRMHGKTPDLSLAELKEVALTNISIIQLAELKNVNWPLTSISVFPVFSPRGHFDLDLMCITFQKFAGTLKCLNFGTKRLAMMNLRLELPHLQQLEVHFEGKVLMDFILPLNSLKVLKVNCFDELRYNDIDEMEIIKFKDAIKDLHRKNATNIWKLFPKLMEVSVAIIKEKAEKQRKETVYIYYRHGDEISKMVRRRLDE